MTETRERNQLRTTSMVSEYTPKKISHSFTEEYFYLLKNINSLLDMGKTLLSKRGGSSTAGGVGGGCSTRQDFLWVTVS